MSRPKDVSAKLAFGTPKAKLASENEGKVVEVDGNRFLIQGGRRVWLSVPPSEQMATMKKERQEALRHAATRKLNQQRQRPALLSLPLPAREQ